MLLGNYNGIPIYDSNDPTNVVQPTLINPYSAFTVGPYKRALDFFSTNLASFPRGVRQNGTRLEVAHYLDRLLDLSPNGYQTAPVSFRTWYLHAAHRGNGYLRIIWKGLRVKSWHNLDPDDVCPFRIDNDDGEGPQQYYLLKSSKQILPAAEVAHLSLFSWDGQSGMDPVQLAADTLNRASVTDKFITKSILKGTMVVGSISIPGEATEEQIKDIEHKLATKFSGAGASNDILVLSGGAKLENATLSAKDNDLINQTGYTTKGIAQFTNVHPYFLFDDRDGKYNANSEQAGPDAVRWTFRPVIVLAEAELTTKLLTDREQEQGYRIHIDPNELLRGDRAAQAEIASTLVAAGIESKNDGRAELGLAEDTDPDSDRLKTAGDTSPAPALPAPATNSATAHEAQMRFTAALQPIIAAAVERVEAKTAKALETATRKPESDRTPYVNALAESQASYAAEALQPVTEALAALGGDKLPIEQISTRYSAAVRRRAATGEGETLQRIMDSIEGPNAATAAPTEPA